MKSSYKLKINSNIKQILVSFLIIEWRKSYYSPLSSTILSISPSMAAR